MLSILKLILTKLVKYLMQTKNFHHPAVSARSGSGDADGLKRHAQRGVARGNET